MSFHNGAVTLDTDVLVVGCGMGGARAALRAQELGADVILVEKAVVGRAGPMTYVHSQYAPPRLVEDPEELKEWIDELVVGGNHIVDQEACALLVQDGYRRTRELVEMGLPFSRNAAGELQYYVLRGHRVGTCLAADGRVCMDILKTRMRRKAHLRLVEKLHILELLTSDGQYPTQGRVVGAVGVHVQTGTPYVIRAKQVILNTGPIYPKMHYCFADHCTGEGVAMAYRAGAALTGMEFLTFSGWGIFSDPHKPGQYIVVGGQAKFQKIGHFINARGERYMDRYDPVWGEQSGLPQTARGTMTEILEGRGPCYMDLRHCTQEELDHLYAVVPSVGRSFREFGIDPKVQPLELNPVMVIGSQSSGGMDAGLADAATNVPGLYAVGYCSSNPHMMSGIGAPITTWSNIGGYRAGEAAARRAENLTHVRIPQAQTGRTLKEFFAPRRRVRQVKPSDLWQEIHRITAEPGFALFKTEARIQRVRDDLRQLEEEMAPRMYAPDMHELVRAREAREYLQVAQLACVAMAARTESRGELFRVDYPYMDNDRWLKWLLLRREGESFDPVITERALPYEKWPIQPPKGQIPVNYPVPEVYRA